MQNSDRATRIFISYSRHDAAFAERLRGRLQEHGFEAYLDTHDIAAGEDWRGRLSALIETADMVVFVISPASLASDVCGWEVHHAEELGKRLLPVVFREPEAGEVPERLQRLNYLFMRSEAEEDAALDDLVAALEVDIDWIRRQTRLGELAGEWNRRKQRASLLLRGADIAEAETWRDRRPASAPEIAPLLLGYINESRRASTRRQRYWIAGSVLVALVTSVLAVLAGIQWQAARKSQAETARVLASSDFRQGTQLVDNPETAPEGLALLARSLRGGDERAATRLWTLLQQRAFLLPSATTPPAGGQAEPVVGKPEVPTDLKARFASFPVDDQQQKVESIAVSGNGERVFTSVGSVVEGTEVKVRVWNRDGTPLTPWFQPPYDGDRYLYMVEGSFSADGRFLAIELQGWRETSYLVVYDLDADKPTIAEKRVGDRIIADGLSPQEQHAGFTYAGFFANNRPDEGKPEILLVTGTLRGDAAVHRVIDGALWPVMQSRHREAVVAVGIDASGEWLMSASREGTVKIARREGRAIGNQLQMDRSVVGFRRAGADGLQVLLEGGGRADFALKELLTVAPPSTLAPVDASEPLCLRADDGGWSAGEEGSTPNRTLSHPSRLKLGYASERQVYVESGVKASSPRFVAPVAAACFDSAGEHVLVATSSFQSEIWSVDFARKRGQGFGESRYFGEGLAPQTTHALVLSADGDRALVQSSFWDPPNVQHYWFTLWDTASGIALADRMHVADTGLSDAPAIAYATFDTAGRYLALMGARRGEAPKPVSVLQVSPPAGDTGMLAGLAEAVAGVAFDVGGQVQPLADRQQKLTQSLTGLNAVAAQ